MCAKCPNRCSTYMRWRCPAATASDAARRWGLGKAMMIGPAACSRAMRMMETSASWCCGAESIRSGR